MSLIAGSVVTHGATYALTNDRSWLATGGLIAAFMPFTMLFIAPHIAALRNAESTDTIAHAKSFVLLHHIRTVVSIAAFGITLRLATQRPL